MGLLLRNKYISSDVKHYLELLQVLVGRNLKVRYRGSILGIYWSLLNPLIMTSLYTAIFGATFAKYYNDSILNYILAAFTGLVVISFFSSSTSQALTSVVNNGALLNRIRLPVSIFPISMIAANVFQFLMGAYPLLAIVALVRSRNLLNAFAILLPFLALVFFCVGVGFFVSALYVFFRDLPYFYELIVFIMGIGTPIFYPAAIVSPKVKPFLMVNPLSPIIESLRQITLSGESVDFSMVASALLSGTIFAVLGWAYFHRSRSQFMDLL
ncbi:ABC transporter permease [Pseudanabaena sp. UWO311]|uniref:ABC transporter permease n=1 Tax=Pseudanabaena sp. UWO311 TaxID=2487337 RepID=UPI0011584DAF|nr:ABC transporter permease [Pseudanabaena sp. UWO311]TYQ27001.1 ABC transporter permease [Pseudanabaena sp. UWO311]